MTERCHPVSIVVVIRNRRARRIRHLFEASVRGIISALDVGQISYADQPQPPPGGYDGATSWALEEAWKFDALGNREWMTVRGDSGATSETIRYSADIMNRYTSVGGETPEYDTDGRLTRSGTYKFAWTVEGRLREVRDLSGNLILNSVAAITGSAGQVIERFQYSIYGQPSRIDVNTGEDLGAILLVIVCPAGKEAYTKPQMWDELRRWLEELVVQLRVWALELRV